MMNSGAFLYALVDPDGFFLILNRGMEAFLRHFPDSDGNILSYCPEGQIESLYSLLGDARHEFIAALVPLVRSDGTQIWIDAEFMPAEAEGREAIQIIGCDVTELAKLRNEQKNAWSLSAWGSVLDSCPGLLCCVINSDKKLLYASPGYRAVASRVLGHKCEVGKIYPESSSVTQAVQGGISRSGVSAVAGKNANQNTEILNNAVREIAYAALAGESGSIDIPEDLLKSDKRNGRNLNFKRIWNLAAAPLNLGSRKAVGAVMRFMAVQDGNSNINSKENDADADEKSDKLDKTDKADKTDKINKYDKNSGHENNKILEAFSERAAVVNERGVCLAANSLFINSLNLNNNNEIQGRPLLDFIPADNTMNTAFHKNFINNILITREGDLECRISTKDGDVIWLDVHAHPVEWSGFQAILLTFADVTRLKRTQAQLRRVTITDGTTGILNRQGIERLLIQRLEKALRDKSPLSLIIFDVDGFRRVNESLGYSAADRMLKAMTLALKGVLSKDDGIGRWGGDEFMVLTPRAGNAAKLLADNLRNMAKNFDSGAADENFEFESGGNNNLKPDGSAITLSAGVAELGAYDGKGGTIEEHTSLIGAAYDAMIQAKHRGGDNTVLHNENF